MLLSHAPSLATKMRPHRRQRISRQPRSMPMQRNSVIHLQCMAECVLRACCLSTVPLCGSFSPSPVAFMKTSVIVAYSRRTVQVHSTWSSKFRSMAHSHGKPKIPASANLVKVLSCCGPREDADKNKVSCCLVLVPRIAF